MSLQDEGVNLSFMLAGLLGSLMTMSRNAGLTKVRTFFATIGGAASANYLTPLILHITKIGHDDVHITYSVAFLIGFMGLRAIELITNKVVSIDESTHHNKRRR